MSVVAAITGFGVLAASAAIFFDRRGAAADLGLASVARAMTGVTAIQRQTVTQLAEVRSDMAALRDSSAGQAPTPAGTSPAGTRAIAPVDQPATPVGTRAGPAALAGENSVSAAPRQERLSDREARAVAPAQIRVREPGSSTITPPPPATLAQVPSSQIRPPERVIPAAEPVETGSSGQQPPPAVSAPVAPARIRPPDPEMPPVAPSQTRSPVQVASPDPLPTPLQAPPPEPVFSPPQPEPSGPVRLATYAGHHPAHPRGYHEARGYRPVRRDRYYVPYYSPPAILTHVVADVRRNFYAIFH
jgi:hypothetical protein